VLRTGAAFESGLPWWNAVVQTSAAFSYGAGGRGAVATAESNIPLSR
jgi:hemolysin activation/secretion protein